MAVLDHTADAILMIDAEGQIVEVNPALERMTGFSRNEVIGKTPALFNSGIHPPAFYEQMRATMAAGLEWSGEMVNRRKDGSFFFTNTLISPLRNNAGEITGYVSLSSDVTAERTLAAQQAQSTSERSLLLEGARSQPSGSSLEARAEAICRHAASLPGIAAAQILIFQTGGRALPIALVLRGRKDPPALQALAFRIGRRLHEKALIGAWNELWANRQGRPYNELVEHAGPSELAYAPIHHGEGVVGLLTVQAIDAAYKGVTVEMLPTLRDFATLAGGLFGREMTERIDADNDRKHVANIIVGHAFKTVFQPIVDMASDRVVGYEALTRFDDGSDPEGLFAEAARNQLGVELEIATLKAALSAAKSLPPDAWLNVNASPELILTAPELVSLLAEVRRPIVVEVTEHMTVADYPAFRDALAALGPHTKLAVDDAGSGAAGLRHILELRPDFLKLDRWLITDLETDDARQAMIVGLRHFGRKVGCRLIAEGVETTRDIEVLRSLDIRLGQGYALGRPMSAGPEPGPILEVRSVA